MARTTYGEIIGTNSSGWQLQPGHTLIERDDGTMEGSAVYKGDEDNLQNSPQVGQTSEKDQRLEVYTRQLEWAKNGYVLVRCSFFGLVSDTTDTIYSMPGGQSTRPIETHPQFATFGVAGNGAKFDADGLFLGFGDISNTEFFGVEYYHDSTTPVTGVYWTSRQPSLQKRGTVKATLKGFKKPDDVKNFLLVDTPFRNIGSFYQVTEQWLGSGENGWSENIYPQ